MPSSLPAELLENIFRHLGIRELRTLCFVCRSFRAEAQRLLYRTLSMPKDQAHFDLWLRTLIDTPRAMAWVHSLTFNSEFEWCMSKSSYMSILEWLIDQLSNLRELYLDPVDLPTRLFIFYEPNYWCGRTLNFRLRLFHNYHYALGDILEFLQDQSDIVDWVQRGNEGLWKRPVFHYTFPDDMLPRLEILDTSGWVITRFRSPRPIQRMRLLFHDVKSTDRLYVVANLGLFGASLTSLRLEGIYTPAFGSFAEMIEFLALQLPNLRYLSIADSSMEKLSPDEYLPVPIFSRFECLRTLVLDSKSPRNGVLSFSGPPIPLDLHIVWRNVNQLRDACPLLRCITILVWPNHCGIRYDIPANSDFNPQIRYLADRTGNADPMYWRWV